jgi:hypothetical protein
MSTHLIGVEVRALIGLNVLESAVRQAASSRSGDRLRLDVSALIWAVLHRDVIVVGDVELLLGHVVSLPDLERLTVGAEVGTKVDAIFEIAKAVGRETDLGAAGLVDPLLKSGKIALPSEAFKPAAKKGGALSTPANSRKAANTYMPKVAPLNTGLGSECSA